MQNQEFQEHHRNFFYPTSSIIEYTNDIPLPSSRVVKGFYVDKTDLKVPWIVALFENDKPACTGSLINDQFILTAAHCVVAKPKNVLKLDMCALPFLKRSQNFGALIGETDIYKAKDNPAKVHQVIQFWIHDKYKGQKCGAWNFDFAVLKLKNPVSNTPVCLYNGVNKGRSEALAIGYGATDPLKLKKDMSRHLKGIELHVLTREKCESLLGWDIGSNKVCCTAAYKNPMALFAGTCSGDSGGPLVLRNKEHGFILAGVTSFGSMECVAHSPGVYGLVSEALPFIKSKAGDIKTC